MGIEKYLTEIKEELMDGKYKPSPVRRVMMLDSELRETQTTNYFSVL